MIASVHQVTEHNVVLIVGAEAELVGFLECGGRDAALA
jgi:hypothetical protein